MRPLTWAFPRSSWGDSGDLRPQGTANLVPLRVHARGPGLVFTGSTSLVAALLLAVLETPGHPGRGMPWAPKATPRKKLWVRFPCGANLELCAGFQGPALRLGAQGGAVPDRVLTVNTLSWGDVNFAQDSARHKIACQDPQDGQWDGRTPAGASATREAGGGPRAEPPRQPLLGARCLEAPAGCAPLYVNANLWPSSSL